MPKNILHDSKNLPALPAEKVGGLRVGSAFKSLLKRISVLVLLGLLSVTLITPFSPAYAQSGGSTGESNVENPYKYTTCNLKAWLSESITGNVYFWDPEHAWETGDKERAECVEFYDNLKNWLNERTLNAFKNLMVTVLTWLSHIFSTILLFLAGITSSVIQLQNTILVNDHVGTVWSNMLAIANVVFVIALLIFAVMIILRQTGYNFKKAVTSLIVAVILANTSAIIVKALNAVTNLVAGWAASIFQVTSTTAGDGAVQAASVNLAHNAIDKIAETFNSYMSDYFLKLTRDIGLEKVANTGETFTVFENLTQMLFVVAFLAIGVYVVYRLFFLFVERMVRIIIYFAFAPLAFAAGLLPNKEMADLPSKWWSELLKWLMVYPAALLLMGFGLQFLNEALVKLPEAGENGLIGAFMDFFKDPSAAPNDALVAFAFVIIAVVLFLTAANVTKVTGVTATAAVGAAAAWLPGMLNKASKATWRTATAPIKAGGKYVGARMKSMGKHAVYRVATSKPLEGITKYIQGKMAAPALLDQAREGERKRYFDTSRAQQIAKRYQSAGSARNQIAKDLFKGKEYKDLDDAEKEKFKKTNQGLKASRNLDMWKYQYMVALGEYTRSSFDKIGRTPDEVKKSFDKNIAKYGENDKDFAAIYEAQKDMNELKMIYIKRTGKPREEAGHHYEEIRNDPKLMGLLEKSVYPFDTPKLGPAVASEVLSGAQPHVRLAIATSDVKKAREELNKINLQLGGLHRGIIEMEIRKVKPQTLEELADAQTNKKKREAFVGLGLPGTLDVLETLTKLTPKDKSEISRIQQDAELSSDEKTVSITQLLGRRGISKEEGRESIAKVLETGVAVEDLAPVSKIASTLYRDTSGLDSATAQADEDTRKVVFGEYIPAARNYQNAQRHQTDIQYAIRTAGGDHPGYRQSYNEAIIKYGAPTVENYVSKKIPNLKSNILSSLGGLKDRTRIEENLKKAIVDVSPDIVDEKTKSLLKRAANRFKVPLGDSATLQQYIDTLEGIESVMRPIKKKPSQGTSEWDEPAETEEPTEPESNEGEKS